MCVCVKQLNTVQHFTTFVIKWLLKIIDSNISKILDEKAFNMMITKINSLILMFNIYYARIVCLILEVIILGNILQI